jgi:hypothetical protein
MVESAHKKNRIYRLVPATCQELSSVDVNLVKSFLAVNSNSATQTIPSLLWNQKIQYKIHSSLLGIGFYTDPEVSCPHFHELFIYDQF